MGKKEEGLVCPKCRTHYAWRELHVLTVRGGWWAWICPKDKTTLRVDEMRVGERVK